MTAKFVRDRITQLRIQKGVSEYKMSYDLGHSRGYINNISSGKALPSLAELFAICEYFDITVVEFFSENIENPKMVRKTLDKIELLNNDDLLFVKQMVDRLLTK